VSYKLEWNASPNFTPGSQTKAIYGRPRTIEFGAGHWWNTPEAGARHDGIVSIFKNPARQGSAHAVLSAGRVTEMVRATDTAWTTNNANPYTYSIEVDPRIMYKWGWNNPSAANKALGIQIFETLAEYIADKRYHSLTWYPHKKWFSTQCNPIHWNEVMIRAKQIRAAKDAPKPAPVPEWKRNLKNITDQVLVIKRTGAPLRNLSNVTQVIKTYDKGTPMEISAETKVNGHRYLLTRYAYDNNTGQGFDEYELEPKAPPQPEWIKNLKDITDVKLMVLKASAVIYDLNTGKPVGSPIPQGTWIDIAKQTVVGGKTYLISKYSVDNAMPNGILKDVLGVPAPTPEPPKPAPEPEWLKNWQDIADIDMYTRKEHVEVVNLLDGSTTTTIPAKGEKIAIASSTEWMGQKYLITKYSTDKKLPHGIRLVDLDIKPVDSGTDPIPADPERPVDDIIKENNTLLKQILNLLKQIWDKLTGK
jgi:hypothetical protein